MSHLQQLVILSRLPTRAFSTEVNTSNFGVLQQPQWSKFDEIRKTQKETKKTAPT